MSVFKRMSKYFRAYSVKNVAAMFKNAKADPKSCADTSKSKLVVITGATAGIGYYAAHKYAAMGADLICINRNQEKSEALSKEIKEKYKVKCDIMITDFSSMSQVKSLAGQLLKLGRTIDVLIHNAGVYLNRRAETEEGFETVFVVNHLSSFYLNSVLLPVFKKQKKGRIILVNSEGHRFAMWGLVQDDLQWTKRRYSGLGSYGSAKLSQLLTMLVFAEQLEGSGVTINAMHPGAVKTEAGKDNGKIYKWYKEKVLERNFKTPEISAEALYYLGVSDEVRDINGKFFNLTTLEDPAPPASDREAATEIFSISNQLCGLEKSTK